MSEGAKACCEAMRAQLNWACEHHAAAFDCPDALVGRFRSSRCYGLYVHDGGSAFVEIRFCPWCGARLPTDAGT
jgi:hypothetical protein